MTKTKAFFNWSGGKDSALALYDALKNPDYEIACLLTNLSEAHQRVSMHGVRLSLLKAQAERINLKLETLFLPENIDMEGYTQLMTKTLTTFKSKGFASAFFGDIFLEDLKKYREDKLSELGIKAVFPLWQKPTELILERFFALGFKAKVVAVSGKALDASFCGRELNESFINDLPEGVDICGENGEFHSFVYDGPIFSSAIPIQVGETVKRTYQADENAKWDHTFWYTDIELINQ